MLTIKYVLPAFLHVRQLTSLKVCFNNYLDHNNKKILQVQWNQNPSTPSVNVVYPQAQNVISPTPYPSATYSFTADFRPPNQSDPLITATSTFKPIQLQNAQKTNTNYGLFQQKPNFAAQKNLGPMLKRSPTKMYMQEGQKDQNMANGYTILNHQGQMHSQEYGYSACVNSSGKVQVRSR